MAPTLLPLMSTQVTCPRAPSSRHKQRRRPAQRRARGESFGEARGVPLPGADHLVQRQAGGDTPVRRVVTVNRDVLDLADRDQHVVLYTADPGSPSEEAPRLLSVLGTQRMDVTGRNQGSGQSPPNRRGPTPATCSARNSKPAVTRTVAVITLSEIPAS